MIERIRSLLRAWMQLTDQEQAAVSQVVLTEICRMMIRENRYEGQTGADPIRTDGDHKRDQAADGADGYLGMVNDTGCDKI